MNGDLHTVGIHAGHDHRAGVTLGGKAQSRRDGKVLHPVKARGDKRAAAAAKGQRVNIPSAQAFSDDVNAAFVRELFYSATLLIVIRIMQNNHPFGGNNMKLTETRLDGKDIFNGKILHVIHDKVELEDGSTAMREVVRHPGGVCVAAIDSDNNLLFVRQFRYPYAEVVLELPAGKLEKGSTPLENGKRELLEETGAIGYSYISLGQVYPSPGYTDEIIHLYACRIKEEQTAQPDAGEFLNIERIPIIKAAEMVLNNQIFDAKTQIAVLKAAALLQSGKI